MIIYRIVSGLATGCRCRIWCHELTTCHLHVDVHFNKSILNNIWFVSLMKWRKVFLYHIHMMVVFSDICIYYYMNNLVFSSLNSFWIDYNTFHIRIQQTWSKLFLIKIAHTGLLGKPQFPPHIYLPPNCLGFFQVHGPMASCCQCTCFWRHMNAHAIGE